MEKQVKIAYIGISIWSSESGYFVGDMGYAFNEEADSRVFEESGYARLRENLEEWINSDDAEDEGGEDFYVYELRTAVGTYDTEEIGRDEIKESELAYEVDIDSDTDEVSEVFVCAPREVAEDIIREEYGMFVTAHYREVENDDDEV